MGSNRLTHPDANGLNAGRSVGWGALAPVEGRLSAVLKGGKCERGPPSQLFHLEAGRGCARFDLMHDGQHKSAACMQHRQQGSSGCAGQGRGHQRAVASLGFIQLRDQQGGPPAQSSRTCVGVIVPA